MSTSECDSKLVKFKTTTKSLTFIKLIIDVFIFHRRDYGFLGITLQQAVFKARNAPPPPPTSTTSAIPQSTTTASVISSITNTPQVPQIRQQITPRAV